MAHISGDSVSHKDFFSKSEETRAQIHLEFDRLIEQINTRRNELLLQLEKAVSRYTRLTEDSQQAFTKLEELKQSSRDILNMNLLTDMQDRVLSELDSEIDRKRKEISNLDVSFEWNDDIEEMIPDLGTLFDNIDRINWNNKPLATIDYAHRKLNLIPQRILHTTNTNSFVNHVCIDRNTSKLYISFSKISFATRTTSINIFGVSVYNQDGDFLFEFGTDIIKYPNSMAVHKDTLYVSIADSNLILKYRIRNAVVPKRITALNKYEDHLTQVGELSIDESNGHVYVCDMSRNTIVRFNKFLGYHSHISGKEIFSPLNLKITETRLIILAKQPNDYPIRFYTKEDYKPVSCLSLEYAPRHFDIDIDGNIVISFEKKTGVYVFSPSGDLLHSIGNDNKYYQFINELVINKTNGMIFIFHAQSNLSIL